MVEIIVSLLSGLVGAFLASIAIITYTEYKDKRKRKLSLAREKLEKVYGPLIALKKKLDLVNQSEGSFLFASNPMEKEMLEKIIFHYYHLVDDDLKEGIVLLHPELSRHGMNMIKAIQLKVDDKIIKHYKENKELLGLK